MEEQDKLFDIIAPVLREARYVVQRYSTLSLAGGGYSTGIRPRFVRTVCLPSRQQPFDLLARELAQRHRNTVRKALAYVCTTPGNMAVDKEVVAGVL